jgi:hypothetical protein
MRMNSYFFIHDISYRVSIPQISLYVNGSI